jgi:hypothetical protein
MKQGFGPIRSRPAMYAGDARRVGLEYDAHAVVTKGGITLKSRDAVAQWPSDRVSFTRPLDHSTPRPLFSRYELVTQTQTNTEGGI